jgi:hypothetical protein
VEKESKPLDQGFPILLFVAGAVLVAVFAYLSHLAEKKRREALRQVAARLGLSYAHTRNREMASRYRFLNEMNQGDSRYAFNVLTGAFSGFPVTVFDFHYATHSTDSKGRRQTHHHYLNYAILEQEKSFPELRIYPEGLFSKLGQMLGFDDIDFESVEFSKAFAVRSKDKKFAYAICHTGLMEHFLRNRELKLEIEGTIVALVFQGRIRPESVEHKLNELIEIRNLFPEYLYHD